MYGTCDEPGGRSTGIYAVKARDAKGAPIEIYVESKNGAILKSKLED